jgi:hypothetical protein
MLNKYANNSFGFSLQRFKFESERSPHHSQTTVEITCTRSVEIQNVLKVASPRVYSSSETLLYFI